jgi:DNA-binding CsgD family transcriptional regulator
MTSSELEEVILKIHAAPLEPRGWYSVIQSLMGLCGAEKALMLTVGLTATARLWERSINFDPLTLQEYASHWATQDLLYLGAVKKDRVRPMVVSTDAQLIDRREYLASPYFNEFLKVNDIEPQLNVCLTNPIPELDVGPAAITLYRGVGKESFDDRETSMLGRLAPHLSLAARPTWRIESLEMVEPLSRRALDEIRVPLFAVDFAGKVLLINSAGEGVIRAKRWIAVVGNVLGPSRGLIGREALRQALSKLRLGTGSSLLLTDGSSREQAVMTTMPLSSSLGIQVSRKTVAGFVWIVPCSAEANSVKGLGRLFQLTPAETRLLQRMVDGMTLSDAAGSLQVSLNTARTQLKAIFRKTGRRTQGQLLALASRMDMIRAND